MTTREQQPSPAAAMKRALTAIDRMQHRIDEYERARSEPIAIVGMACRLPGGVTSPGSYWDLLSEGRDAISEIPPDRWDVASFYDETPLQPGKISSRWGGFLEHIDRFDHEFFGISRREAVVMDPQQRLLLELSWEALEDAGQPPHALAGSDTGVFVGMWGTDYLSLVLRDPADITAYAGFGNAHSIAAGRVAYSLDLSGPAIAVDTACSSSLVAVHLACQSLRLGETDLAICGAVNAIVSPQASISMSQISGSFAGDGRIKSFDAAADGFVRGEGCAVVVLKRLRDVRETDRVHALIRGSAVNQDGRSAGLTAPSGTAQRAVLRRALRASGVEPGRVGLIETHGTGTRLGDPIEADALAEVYGHPGAPVLLGAAKTNLGHLESAAGLAGLIKATMCLDRGLIPANLHFSQFSPDISADLSGIAVPTELTPWPAREGPRAAAVSAFGLSGTNAHVILEQAPPRPAATPDDRRPLSVLALSAKTEAALVKLARRYTSQLSHAGAAAADVCYSAGTRRSHFPWRLAAVAGSTADLADRLAGYVHGDPTAGLVQGRASSTGSDVVFLFSGAGSQRPGMTRQLYQTQPTFRRVVDRCAELLRPVLDPPLLDALYPDDPDSRLIYDVEYVAAGMFTVEYALAELWRSWGVEPAAVIGHSLGEYTAACVAGVMSLEDGLRLVTERARLLEKHTHPGTMATIFAPREQVAAELAGHDPAHVAIGAVNGPASITISGFGEQVEAVCAAFAARGVDTKQLHVPRPGHSPLVEPTLPPLRQALERVTFAPPRIPMVSNVTGQLWPWDAVPDAGYWCRHTRQPVLFADGVGALYELGYRTFLEIGPATSLLGLAGEILPAGDDLALLPSLRPAQPDWDVLLSSVSQLYVRGAGVDWAGFDQDYSRSAVELPSYPFSPVRCWYEPSDSGTPVSWGQVGAPGGSRADPPGGRPADDPADRPGGDLPRPGSPAGSQPSTLPSVADLLRLPAGERAGALIPGLAQSAQRALGAQKATDVDEPLSNLGFDSLMAVELRTEIQRRLQIPLGVASFLSGATIRSLAGQIAAQVADGQHGESGPGGEDGSGGGSGPITRVERVEDVLAELLDDIEAPPGDLAGSAHNGERDHD